MNLPETPQLLLERNYVDIDEWGQEIGWDFEYRQIESGSASASAIAFGSSHCVATRGAFTRSFYQVGAPPEGRLTFGLPDTHVAEFRWCGKNATGGDMLNFNLEAGFQGVSPSGFSGITISFSEGALQDATERLELNIDFPNLVRKPEIWEGASPAAKSFGQQLSRIFGDTALRNSGQAEEFFNHKAAVLLLQCISGRATAGEPESITRRRRAVRIALERIEQSENLPVTVSELCRYTGASSPTLYRGFEEEFGIGPKRYIQIRRLAGVRKELLARGNSESLPIADVANRWGFWHMGQFAADYRRHFGELPSQTRARSRGKSS